MGSLFIVLQAPENSLETRREVSYNHDQNFNRLEHGISATVYIHKTKQYGANAHAGLNDNAKILASGSLVLKTTAWDLPWWLVADLARTIYLPVGSVMCPFLSGHCF